MEELLNKITLLLGNLAEKHGETAVYTMLETARLMAINDLLRSISGLLLALALISYAYIAKWPKEEPIEEWYAFGEYIELTYLRKIMGYVFGFFFLTIALPAVINPILWKSISDPKIYITYNILQKGLK